MPIPGADYAFNSTAKEHKLRLWKDFVAKEKTSESDFDAQVVKIVTGDTIIVRSKAGGEKKVQFSSLKQAPRYVVMR